jgi:hypothetical protein
MESVSFSQNKKSGIKTTYKFTRPVDVLFSCDQRSAPNMVAATRTGEMQNAHRIWYENPKTRDHFEDRRKM